MSKIDELKEQYIEYYEDVPVQKYAAMAIARDEDTIIRWKKDDQEFADAVNQAKARWVRKRVLATKAEFALERLEKSIFSQSSTTHIETSPYDQFVRNNTLDPNAPEVKAEVDKITAILMESTRSG